MLIVSFQKKQSKRVGFSPMCLAGRIIGTSIDPGKYEVYLITGIFFEVVN